MYLKELVEKMNGMPMMFVRITFGGRDTKGLAYARPAYYNGDDDSATLFEYFGPLDPRRCDFPFDNGYAVESVEKHTLIGRGKDNFEVFPHETYLDTMPLRDLPLTILPLACIYLLQGEQVVPPLAYPVLMQTDHSSLRY